jgi:hypothetical protein
MGQFHRSTHIGENPPKFPISNTTAARHARAVAEMIEGARLRVAVALNMPIYALDEDEDDDGGDDAA